MTGFAIDVVVFIGRNWQMFAAGALVLMTAVGIYLWRKH